jgi:hypothetical protein
VTDVGGAQELRGNVRAVLLRQRHQERKVGELPYIVGEERRLAVDEELLEDHVPHRESERAVGAGVRVQPLVGELGVVRVVRGDDHDLLAAVAGLGHPVRVGGAGHRDVRAPHHQIRGVPPVARLRHVGLVAEDLRGGDREVGVPVVEGEHRRADEAHETGPRGMRHHRHRGDGREPGDTVGAVCLDGG